MKLEMLAALEGVRQARLCTPGFDLRHVHCDSRRVDRGTGFLARAAKPACAAVRRGVLTDVAKTHRTARLCTEVYGGPQRARITGTVGRRRIAVSIDRGDGCGIDDWNRLRALLGAPERSGAITRTRASVTTTTTPPPVTYRVERGDTLTEIAKQFQTSVGAIVASNRLEDPDHLVEDQELVMPPPSAVRIDAALVDAGKNKHDDNCENCHADSGRDAAEDAGILAGQWTEYLREQFQHYRDGTRSQPEKMEKKVATLTDQDIEALLNFYASMQ